MDPSILTNIFLQTWDSFKSDLPPDVKRMLKVAREVNLTLDGLDITPEVKRTLPIWLHQGWAPGKNRRTKARCLQTTHKVFTTGDAQDVAEGRDENLAGCEDTAACRRRAQHLLDALDPKWDPRIPRAPNNRSADTDEAENKFPRQVTPVEDVAVAMSSLSTVVVVPVVFVVILGVQMSSSSSSRHHVGSMFDCSHRNPEHIQCRSHVREVPVGRPQNDASSLIDIRDVCGIVGSGERQGFLVAFPVESVELEDRLNTLSEVFELLDDSPVTDTVAVDMEKFAEVAEEALFDAPELVSPYAEAGTTKAINRKERAHGERMNGYPRSEIQPP
ncbi:hypothetical protein BDZ89DRAFT_1045096 [Hymenopellis radicata]|nr:hypothetical protein BDZ89DRAFT_1045096 [Hymenopellis radicata]